MHTQSPTHNQLTASLREIVEHAQVSSAELDVVIQEMRMFLPTASQHEMNERIAQGDVVAIRLTALCGLSAATLLRMSTSQAAPDGLLWEDWLRAVLDAVGMPQIEEDSLRQLAFDVLICALSDLDADDEDSGDAEEATEPAVGAALPTLSLPRFRVLQQQGRAFLQIH